MRLCAGVLGKMDHRSAIVPVTNGVAALNRFQCPYERTNFNEDDVEATDSRFNVEDLGGDD